MTLSHTLVLTGLTLLGGALLIHQLRQHTRRMRQERLDYIEAYRFPAALRSKLALLHPQLDSTQLDQVFRALRQYFLICLYAGVVRGKGSVGMPSRLADDAWHEFILMSREYSLFCQRAFGGYLHHQPAETMLHGIEKPLINTLHQLRTQPGGTLGWATLGGIPLLFALDKAYAVPDGYHYGPAEMARLEEKRRARRAMLDGSLDLEGSGCIADSGSGCGGGGCGGGCG